jgi:type I restriction enzyme, S subunit
MRWTESPMSDIAEINPRRPGDIRELPDEHLVTFVPMPAVCGATGAITNAERRPLSDVRKGFTYFAEGDVIFAKITPCMQNGKSAIARGLANGLGFGSTEFHVIRPDLRKAIPEWLHFYVRRQSFRQEGVHHFRGAVGQQRVPPQYLAGAVVSYPESVDEQRRIVARIRECMERIDEIETLHAKTLCERNALSSSLIESEIRSRDGVVELPIGSLVTKTRNGRSIAEDSTGKADGTVLTLTAVRSINLGLDFRKPIVLPEKVYRKFSIQVDDVFVSRANTIELVGLSAVAVCSPPERMIYPDLLIKMHADRKKIIPRYLVYALRSSSARRQIKDRALGSSQTMVKISGERLREISIPVPDIDAQEEIVERLDAAHSLLDQLSTALAEEPVSTLRESVLHKAFAGEL